MQNEDKKNRREISGGLLVYCFIGLLVCWVIVVEKKKKNRKKNWTVNVVNYIVLCLFSA